SIRQSGHDVSLFYFWLESADVAVSRVANRVQVGGHHVPEATIRQRYSRSVRNLFELYMPVVNNWKIYDNSGKEPHFIAEGGRGTTDRIADAKVWDQLRKVMDDA